MLKSTVTVNNEGKRKKLSMHKHQCHFFYSQNLLLLSGGTLNLCLSRHVQALTCINTSSVSSNLNQSDEILSSHKVTNNMSLLKHKDIRYKWVNRGRWWDSLLPRFVITFDSLRMSPIVDLCVNSCTAVQYPLEKCLRLPIHKHSTLFHTDQPFWPRKADISSRRSPYKSRKVDIYIQGNVMTIKSTNSVLAHKEMHDQGFQPACGTASQNFSRQHLGLPTTGSADATESKIKFRCSQQVSKSHNNHLKSL